MRKAYFRRLDRSIGRFEAAKDQLVEHGRVPLRFTEHETGILLCKINVSHRSSRVLIIVKCVPIFKGSDGLEFTVFGLRNKPGLPDPNVVPQVLPNFPFCPKQLAD